RILGRSAYLSDMPKLPFEPCIPTRGIEAPCISRRKPVPRPTPALDSAERLQSKQVRSVYQAVEMFFCATFLLTGREHLAVGWRTSSAASPHFAGSPLAQLARRVDWILLSDWSVEP